MKLISKIILKLNNNNNNININNRKKKFFDTFIIDIM